MSGIDMLHLTTTDVQIKDMTSQNFGINCSKKQGGGELPKFTDLSGNTVQCNSIFHFSDVATFDYGLKGLRIILNPSKKFHEYNLLSTGKQFNELMNTVQKQCDNLGIKTDVNQMSIARLDLAKNSVMNFPVHYYSEAFGMVKGKRTRNKENISSYYIGNKQHEVCFYDKQAELIERHKGKYYEVVPENFMRSENRFKKTKQVLKHSNISTLSMLKDVTPLELEDIRKNYLNKIIFNQLKSGHQTVIDWNSEVEFFQNIKTSMPRVYMNHWLMLRSVDELMNDFKTLENLKLFFESCGEKRIVVYRNIKKIQQLIDLSRSYKKQRNDISPSELLDEVVLKFAS
jgi:hypothetical protein